MKCWECGKEVEDFYPIGTRIFCKECHDRIVRENEEDLKQYLMLKNKIMINRAITIFA